MDAQGVHEALEIFREVLAAPSGKIVEIDRARMAIEGRAASP
jgi:hypothetical protein